MSDPGSAGVPSAAILAATGVGTSSYWLIAVAVVLAIAGIVLMRIARRRLVGDEDHTDLASADIQGIAERARRRGDPR